MRYSFAGLIVEINYKYEYARKLCEKYVYNGSAPTDFSVEVTEQMIAAEREKDPYNSPDPCLESIAAYRQICNMAFDYDCMFMHCSALSYKGNGVLFTAPSGTGKSTHSALWAKTFGEDVVMVNDDKPLLRKINGEWYVCGTPWDGKHHISNNISVPVKAIVIIRQSKENIIETASNKQAVITILNQTIRPENPDLMAKTLDNIQSLTSAIPVYSLGCDISKEAVLTAFSGIKENFNED